jgi:hypothetical protein
MNDFEFISSGRAQQMTFRFIIVKNKHDPCSFPMHSFESNVSICVMLWGLLGFVVLRVVLRSFIRGTGQNCWKSFSNLPCSALHLSPWHFQFLQFVLYCFSDPSSAIPACDWDVTKGGNQYRPRIISTASFLILWRELYFFMNLDSHWCSRVTQKMPLWHPNSIFSTITAFRRNLQTDVGV